MAHEPGGAERGALHDVTGPLLLWLLIQTAALALSALRVPLAAGYAQPAELLAAHVMLVAQVTAAGLLFPYLMRSVFSAAAVAATAVPFVVLAGILSAAPSARIAAAAAYLILWLAALAAWCFALRDATSRLRAAAVATLMSMGALILLYLRLEFGEPVGAADDARSIAAAWAGVSPPLAALRQLSGPPALRDWALVSTVLAAGVSAPFLLRARTTLSTRSEQTGRSPHP